MDACVVHSPPPPTFLLHPQKHTTHVLEYNKKTTTNQPTNHHSQPTIHKQKTQTQKITDKQTHAHAQKRTQKQTAGGRLRGHRAVLHLPFGGRLVR
jgi:hypothetical protein